MPTNFKKKFVFTAHIMYIAIKDSTKGFVVKDKKECMAQEQKKG